MANVVSSQSNNISINNSKPNLGKTTTISGDKLNSNFNNINFSQQKETEVYLLDDGSNTTTENNIQSSAESTESTNSVNLAFDAATLQMYIDYLEGIEADMLEQLGLLNSICGTITNGELPPEIKEKYNDLLFWGSPGGLLRTPEDLLALSNDNDLLERYLEQHFYEYFPDGKGHMTEEVYAKVKEDFKLWVQNEYTTKYNEYVCDVVEIYKEKYKSTLSWEERLYAEEIFASLFKDVNTLENLNNRALELQTDLLKFRASLYAMRQQKKLMPYIEISETDEYKEYLNNIDKNTAITNGREIVTAVMRLNTLPNNIFGAMDYMSYLDYMTEDEIIMCNYLVKTKGVEEVNNYLEAIKDSLNQRKGQKEAEDFLKLITDENGVIEYNNFNTWLTAGQGVLHGIETFGEGLNNLFVGADGVMTDTQYAQMYILQEVSSFSANYMNYVIDEISSKHGQDVGQEVLKMIYNEDGTIDIDYAKKVLTEEQLKNLSVKMFFDKFNVMDDSYQIGSSIGNMLPSMAVTYVVSKVCPFLAPHIGNTLMGMSAAGNAINQKLIEGSDLPRARLYGLLVGTSETTLGLMLGNIPGLNSNARLGIKELLSEGIEEGMQTYVEAYINKALYGGTIDMSELHGEALTSFIYGIITSGITTGGKLGFNLLSNGKLVSINNINDFWTYVSLMNSKNVGVVKTDDGSKAIVIDASNVKSHTEKQEIITKNVDKAKQVVKNAPIFTTFGGQYYSVLPDGTAIPYETLEANTIEVQEKKYDYKYRRGQVFGKTLPVPSNILNNVYDNTLSLEDYIRYDLVDKIPVSCIKESDRSIIEKFGVEKAKGLDYELLGILYAHYINYNDLLMSIDPQTEDINLALYELVKNKILPHNYTSNMKEIYADTIKQYNELLQSSSQEFRDRLNEGKLTAEDIFDNFEIVRELAINQFPISNRITIECHNKGLNILINYVLPLDSITKKDIEKIYYNNKYREEICTIYNYNSGLSKTIMEKAIEQKVEEIIYNEFLQQYNFSTLIQESQVRISQTIKKIGTNNFIKYCEDNLKEINFEMLFEANNIFWDEQKRYVDDRKLSYDEITELLDNACVYTLLRTSKYNNLFSNTFIERHKELFLPDDAPKDLKDKFYSKTLTLEDVMSNIEYFKETNISVGFEGIHPQAQGIFSNDVFLKLLEISNEKINDIITLAYEATNGKICLKVNYINSYEKLASELEKHYIKNKLLYRNLILLKKYNLMNTYFTSILNNYTKLNVQFGTLEYLDLRIFDNEIVDKLGFNVIETILEYHTTNASEIVLDYYFNDKTNYNKLGDWLIYLNKNNLLNKANVIHSILSFPNMSNIVEELLSYDKELSQEQKNNLQLLIINKNRENVINIEQLTNYTEHKMNYLNNKLNSGTINEVQSAIFEILFDMDSHEVASDAFIRYKLNYMEFISSNFSEFMSTELKATIEIMREILSSKDITLLKNRFKDIIKLGYLGLSKIDFFKQLDTMYTKLWNSQLFKHNDGDENYEVSYINGIDSAICKTNVDGNPISSKDTIKVVHLNGQPFKLIVHAFKPNDTPDELFKDFSGELFKNPSLWNTFEGATTLSTSLISDYHLKMFTEIGDRYRDYNVIFYGINELYPDSYRGDALNDAGTPHGGGLFSVSTDRDTPNSLLIKTNVNGYNEVILMRKSSQLENKFDGRIQPNCIICFNGKINDESKLAAQYYNVPIYMIYTEVYDHQVFQSRESYHLGKISKFENSDIDKILISDLYEWTGTSTIPTNKSSEEIIKIRYELCLSLSEKALQEGIITEEEYLLRLHHIRKVLIQNYPVMQQTENLIKDLDERIAYITNTK